MIDSKRLASPASAPHVESVAGIMRQHGLESFSFLGGRAVAEIAARLDPAVVSARGLDKARGAVALALPYDPRPRPVPTGEGRFGSIGAFASSNRYAALARIFDAVGRASARETGAPRTAFRIAVNSRLPEKAFAVLSGRAFIGRSSLAVTETYGPSCVLGVLTLPFDPGDASEGSPEAAREPGGRCGACRACVDACPTGAIRAPGSGRPGLDRDRCIQYWASNPGAVPPEVADSWGRRVYGCDICVAACPASAGAWIPDAHGTSPADRAESLLLPAEARPGSWVDLEWLIGASDGDVAAWTRASALGLNWLSPELLRRNARVAAAALALI